MKNSLYILAFAIAAIGCHTSQPTEGLFVERLTGNNAVSYTDVTFAGVKDTVLVTTMSGRVAFRYKDHTEENVVGHIDDEIYVVSYNNYKKHIALSTLGSGIIILDANSGKELHKLPVIDTWCLSMGYSKNEEYLYANDQRGNRFIWSVANDYKPVNIPETMPQGHIRTMDVDVLTIVSRGKLIRYDLNKQQVLKEDLINFIGFADMDDNGNVLSVNHNTASLFNINSDTAMFTIQHPGWLRSIESYDSSAIEQIKQAGLTIENGYFEDPNYHMSLTAAKFGKDKIFTSSIDRSIRVWDKKTGQLLKSITGHKATVNKIKMSPDENQLVSIDLKGGIQFNSL